MSKINTFSKSDLQSIRTEINAALKVVEEKFGIKLNAGNASFSPDNFTLKLEGSLVVGGEAVLKEATEFKRYSQILGLKPEDLGREFKHQNKTWKLKGFSPKKIKCPMMCEEVSTGKMYMLPQDAVVNALK